MKKKHIFISHSTRDDTFLNHLRKSLEIQGLNAWVDSRRLTAGDELEKEIKTAIRQARAFILVLSFNAFNSLWMVKEIKHALEVKKERTDDYPVIPLMLEGVEPAALGLYFEKEPVGITVKVGPGGISEAMPQILAALGEREPEDIQPMLTPPAEPLEELLLELAEPSMVKKEDGTRRARAKARLTYIPGEKGKREVESKGRFLFTASLGPIESEELTWYLERYYTWPTGVFKERAKKVEQLLPEWGKALYDAVLNHPSVGYVLEAWENANRDAGRRFTVFVDSRLITDAEEKEQAEANEAAALLLGLPWELMYKEGAYLFQGARPVRVRRRLPNRKSLQGSVSEPPIRILLVSPRPEDDRAGYIDHRVSALPLVTALESLGDMAQLTVLSPPTFPALEEELKAARKAGTPYHVVHFDGHGVYYPDLGRGALCFESPWDSEKLEKRRSKMVNASELAAVTRDFRIPLFFLEACETAKAEEDPTASVAAALLDEGVASVVAMSHSVLVETARRFVERFYRELAAGSRVGDAMAAGQRALKSDSYRLKIFGAGRLDLQDWFVPVLYQEKDDLQLLTRVPSRAIEEIDRKALQNRYGALPPAPGHHFIGRSRELLKLERLLARESYAVVCGQGGEGKTTLAVELARWLVRTRRFRRAVFVAVENVNDVRTVVDEIGRQLVPGFSAAEYSPADLLTKALQHIESRLKEDRTLVVLDNMETILPPVILDKSFSGGQGPRGAGNLIQKSPLVSRFEPEALGTFFVLCRKMQLVGDTCLLFTSRQALPVPFDMKSHRVTLGRLDKRDAVELVHQAMTAAGLTPKEDETGRVQPEVEALVESVNCHARSLVLLAPYIGEFGVRQTTESLGRLMADLHGRYPDERERSLFASVELSLGRLSPGIREKIRSLGVFQGGGYIVAIGEVLDLKEEERDILVGELLQTGLAESMAYNFFRFHPALCPYLRRELEDDEAELTRITARWAESMLQLSVFLYQQLSKDAQIALCLTTLELPNLVRLLEHMRELDEPEAVVNLAARLEQLTELLGRKHLLAQVAAIREEKSKKLPDWSNTRFNSSKAQIERLLGSGHFPRALQEAQSLLEKCLQTGEGAYSEAAFDTAVAYFLLGRVLSRGGAAEAALQPYDEAHRRFQRLADQGNAGAAGIASVPLAEKGNCLRALGRLGEAAEAYEAGIRISGKLERFRDVAVGKGQLGTVRTLQKRYNEALSAHNEALKIFEDLGEPASVAIAWHQIGRVYYEANRFEAAEEAYRQGLAIQVQQNDPAGESASLNQLGMLYMKMGRLEDAVIFYRQAADKSVEIGDRVKEGLRRSNLANTLVKLKRYDEARGEIHRAIECRKPYSHAAQLWATWNILHNIEQAEGNRKAAERAREQAIRLYLDYRRDGGENHNPGGRVCAWFRQALQEQPVEEIKKQFTALENEPDIYPFLKVLIPKLRAILAGSRDPGLAADPKLYFDDAAEILFLLETVKERCKG